MGAMGGMDRRLIRPGPVRLQGQGNRDRRTAAEPGGEYRRGRSDAERPDEGDDADCLHRPDECPRRPALRDRVAQAGQRRSPAAPAGDGPPAGPNDDLRGGDP